MHKVSIRMVSVQHGGGFDTAFGITKEPVAPPQRGRADTVLNQIVIQFDEPVIEKYTQSSPMLNQITQSKHPLTRIWVAPDATDRPPTEPIPRRSGRIVAAVVVLLPYFLYILPTSK
jgi:hypothetical protein